MNQVYNHSNNIPLGADCIVYIDAVLPEKDSIIIDTERGRDIQAHQQTTGILLEIGSGAFKNLKDKPRPGDRLRFPDFIGKNIRENGLFYRQINDHYITAIYSKDSMNESNHIPVNNGVIIHLDNIKESTAGGLIVPIEAQLNQAKEQTSGILIAVGAHAFEDLDVKPTIGDRVKFQKHCGTTIDENKKWFRILSDKEVHAIYKPQTKN